MTFATFEEFLSARDAVFRNPTLESATQLWETQEFPPPVHPSVPLAAVHKGRLQWLDATDAMLEESMKWLTDNGYEITMKGAPPLTSATRDEQRVQLGKKPLNEH